MRMTWQVVKNDGEVVGTYSHPVAAETVAAAHNRNLYNRGRWCHVRQAEQDQVLRATNQCALDNRRMSPLSCRPV